MNIGLPRALLYYYYYPFWKAFFETLGHTIVLSDKTNAKIITQGANVTVSELCVPVKIFNGHIMNLAEKDIDRIFVPEFTSMGREWYCPKFMGIDSIVKSLSPDLTARLLIMPITSKDDMIARVSDYLPFRQELGTDKKQIKAALKQAKQAQTKFRDLCIQGYTAEEALDIMDGKTVQKSDDDYELTIALMGYVYNVYDNFISMDIVKKLRGMGVRVLTFEMLDEQTVKYNNARGKQPFWVFARKIYNASGHYLKQPNIDGMIHVTAFACGPDSIIGKYMELDCDKKNLPFMTLRVDEHTGEGHVQTRLEAFTDMLKISKNKR